MWPLSRLLDLNRQFIEIQVFCSIFTALSILGFHYMYVCLDREGREEPPEIFGKSVTKMVMMSQ